MILPKGRTELYQIWRVCERWGIRPEGVKDTFKDCPAWLQARLIAYEQIRQNEEVSEWSGLGLKSQR